MKASYTTGDHSWNYPRQQNIENCSGFFLAVLREPSKRIPHPKAQNKNIPTNSSDEVEVAEITSSSDTEDVDASSLNQEVTSPSNNEDNATDTNANEEIPKADTTSPSSEILSHVPVNGDVGAHTRPSKIRKYTMRRKRTGAPSVPVQGISCQQACGCMSQRRHYS